MASAFSVLDEFLRGRGDFAVAARPAGRLKWLLAFVFVFGFAYGAVMGSFSALAAGRYQQMLYAGLKVPVLLLVTFAICLPSFFVVNSVAGLRADFGEALRAVIAAQACVAVVLASLAPVTAMFYLSSSDYSLAVFFNGVMFAVASLSAQIVTRRYYGPLVERAPRHRLMLVAWLFFYVFVGIQMAWVLRPFIGDPNMPVAFFRGDAWGNAYVVITKLTAHFVRRLLLW